MKNIAKRVAALTMAILLVTTMAVSAFAYDEKTVTFKNNATVQFTTGRGLKYFFGKKTTITFTNESKRIVNLYTPGAGPVYTLDPNQSKTFQYSGNGKTYTFKLQKGWFTAGMKHKVKVTTDNGSLSCWGN